MAIRYKIDEVRKWVKNINNYSHLSIDGEIDPTRTRKDKERMMASIRPIFPDDNGNIYYIGKENGRYNVRKLKGEIINTRDSRVRYIGSISLASKYTGIGERELENMITREEIKYQGGFKIEDLNRLRDSIKKKAGKR